MIRSLHSVWTGLVALGGIGGIVFFATGCDGSGSKRDSLFQQLIGTWRIERVELDGRNTINNFEEPVRVEFLQRDDARSYRIVRGASPDPIRSGRVDVSQRNILRMISGFNNRLVWRFTFEEPEDISTSVRFRLESALEEDVQTFLDAIGLRGSAQRLVIDLDFESE